MGDLVDYALPIRTQFHYDRYRVRKESCTGIVRLSSVDAEPGEPPPLCHIAVSSV